MDTAMLTRDGLVFLDSRPGQGAAVKNAAIYPDWDAFVRSGVEPQGFFLRSADGQDWKDWIERIRHSDWWNLPVFADPQLREAKQYVDALCTVENAREITEGMALRRLTMPSPVDVVGLEERLLHFLYERGGQAAFVPMLDRNSDQLYRYPSAELLAYAHENADETLEALRRRGLLRLQGLVDRTRHCNSCGSAHIHFVDVCPHCQSLDIHKEPTLHCFACGNVGAESHFLSQGALACPKCHVHLRHIGVDYDKPLEQYLCGACQHTSMEARVQARCLDCGNSGSPSELEVREVGNLLLSSSGRQAVRSSAVGESFAPLKARNYVDPAGFRRMLDWASSIQARHPQFQFHLMRLELQHRNDAARPLSPWRVTMLLDELAARLNALLRESDVITRVDEHSLWLLLPFTEATGLQARIENAMHTMVKEDGNAHQLTVRIHSLEVEAGSNSQDTTAPSAQSLMQRLQPLAQEA